MQAFRGNVQEFNLAVADALDHRALLADSLARVEAIGLDTHVFEAVDLVFHKGDQRRDDDGHAFFEQSGKLEAQRFAAAGGKDGQGFPVVEDGQDGLLLPGAELGVAPVALEAGKHFLRDVVSFGHRWYCITIPLVWGI